MPERRRFTEEQEHAMGHILADSIGSHIQTGTDGQGDPYVYTQWGPGSPVKKYTIKSDGTVLIDYDS